MPRLTPKEILAWYPRRWSDIVANRQLVTTWHDFIVNGGTNVLVTGPSRTGKTRVTALGIMALMCSNRTATMDPCGQCQSCNAIGNARHSHYGLDHFRFGTNVSFFSVDCGAISPDDLRLVLKESALEETTTYLYLDQVADLGQRGLEPLLLKAPRPTHQISPELLPEG